MISYNYCNCIHTNRIKLGGLLSPLPPPPPPLSTPLHMGWGEHAVADDGDEFYQQERGDGLGHGEAEGVRADLEEQCLPSGEHAHPCGRAKGVGGSL